MNLGVNPLLQFGLKETREMLCRNILADLSVIRYVPFDSDTIGNPALDSGDVLTFAGGQVDETNHLYHFHQTEDRGKADPEMCGKESEAGSGKVKE